MGFLVRCLGLDVWGEAVAEALDEIGGAEGFDGWGFAVIGGRRGRRRFADIGFGATEEAA